MRRPMRAAPIAQPAARAPRYAEIPLQFLLRIMDRRALEEWDACVRRWKRGQRLHPLYWLFMDRVAGGGNDATLYR